MLWLPLVAALLLHSSLTGAQWDKDYKHDSWDYKDGGQDYKDGGQCCGWKCMLFTLQWPGSFCQILYNETLCKIPPNVNDWTIHGLWPFKAHNCCHCWPMFHSDIKDLETNLTEFWPSFLKTRSDFQFWRSEWLKHGVCAACVEGLNSPLRYFQTCLQLRARFDVHSLLDKAGITPSCNTTYEVEQLRRVVAPLFGDHHEIQCFKDKQGRELWFQMKVSLSPNGTTGCKYSDLRWAPKPPVTHPCPPDVPLYYPPIDHSQPPKTCP
ncbi:ribonuclease T2-like [Eucyclogobius newberryi]|uniref:ribonuclease T2-like n=1 Tax=Eucyclogobius newberryi TaxID=166745 RepID=UPI003B58ECCD